MIAVGVLVFGAIGAVARYFVDGVVTERVEGSLPYGTLVVNVAGSFILGVVLGLVLYHGGSASTRTLIGTGFCGAFTTWSALSWETTRLVEDGASRAAVLAVVVGVSTSLLAAAAGLVLGSL